MSARERTASLVQLHTAPLHAWPAHALASCEQTATEEESLPEVSKVRVHCVNGSNAKKRSKTVPTTKLHAIAPAPTEIRLLHDRKGERRGMGRP